ncbi:extracellular solute-binding protein [Paenibacillus sp. 1011MAR3C5]|uniref:ABC transporter substrate-binding protein n=1 Tax=Paenibacillus sp. 1011MAR3C5 TaxID=1675787 RepID=UPI000E6C952E|nr:extracellular solute-binding protein [Paenibacillus sp. 1011MAR3C5]RJE85552.1 extracellular solute-binding protein [Paenibacillus sp. 1011MAR3C5]
MKKSALTIVSLLLVMTMFLAACGGNKNNSTGGASNTPSNTPSETQEPSKEPDPVNLRVFSTFGGTDAAREAFQKALDEFTAANPHVKIENDTMSANDDGFRTKVNTDMTSGNEPDLLFYFIGTDASEIIKSEKVVPLDEVLDADPEWKNGFAPAALEFAKHEDGKTYAIPLTGFFEGLLVNKKIFADNGIELPTDWEKMKAAVTALKAKNIIPLSGPFDQSHYLLEHFILAAAGSESQNKGLKDAVDPNWAKGLEAMKELYDLGAFPEDAATIDLGMAANYYSEGLAAMVLEGSWAIGGLSDETKANTTVLPFPAIPGGAGTGKDVVGGFGTGFYVSKATYDDAAKKEAAVALLKHLTSPATIKNIAEANGGTPAAAGVEPEGVTQAVLDGFKMVSEASSVNSPIDSKVTQETFSELRANVQPVVTGKKTAAEAIDAAKKIEDAAK